MKNLLNKKLNTIFIWLSCALVAGLCLFSCNVKNERNVENKDGDSLTDTFESLDSATVYNESPKTFSIIENMGGNGEYVVLYKKIKFSDSCGDTINIKLRADTGELLSYASQCTTNDRPMLILGPSEYYPIEQVKNSKLNKDTISEQIMRLEPINFFVSNDSLNVKFPSEEQIEIKIFYGLTDKLVGKCKADSILYSFPIDSSDNSVNIDTFRVAGTGKLSYLVTVTNIDTAATVSTGDSTASIDTPKNKKTDRFVFFCIGIVFIACVFLIIEYVPSKNRQNENIPQFDNKPIVESLKNDNNLCNVDFIIFTIQNEGKKKTQNEGKKNKEKSKKFIIYDYCRNIRADNAQKYIDFLLKEYYGRYDEKLKKYLNDQIITQESFDLKVPYLLDKQNNKQDDAEWLKYEYKNHKLYYKAFPDYPKDIAVTSTCEPKNSTLPDEESGSAEDNDANNNSQNTNFQTEQNDIIVVTDDTTIQHEESVIEQQTVSDSDSEEKRDPSTDSQSPTTQNNEGHETILNELHKKLENKEQENKIISKSLRLEKERSEKLQSDLNALNQKIEDTVKEKVADVKENLTEKEKALEETTAKLNELNKNFETLKKKNDELQKQYNTLDNKKKEVDKKLEGIESKHSNEINELNKKHKDDVERITRKNKDALQKQKDQYEETISVYSSHFKIYKGCGSYTSNACDFFNSLDQLLQEQVKLSDKISNKKINDTEKDTFNYYFASVTNKYHKAITGLKLDEYRKELADLNETNMTRTGREVDKILKTSSPSKYVDDLRYRAYDGLFKKLCGASIVLSDDLASLNQLCPSAVSKSDIAVFSDITKSLLKSTRDMGYSPIYVKLFTPYSDYSDISVEKTIELEGTNKKDVVEILEMAVNYGTQKSKTKVSANV